MHFCSELLAGCRLSANASVTYSGSPGFRPTGTADNRADRSRLSQCALWWETSHTKLQCGFRWHGGHLQKIKLGKEAERNDGCVL